MQHQYSLRSPAVKRLMREALELKEPTQQYYAQPLDDNLFEWHFTIRGSAGSEFEGGVYHGRIILPPDYPMKPPSITFLSSNGRFEVNTKICLSISGHHPESWQPSWSIRTALLAIIGFMPTPGHGAIGSLDYTPEERRRLARLSTDFTCDRCGDISAILMSVTSKSNADLAEAQELAAQIHFEGEKPREVDELGHREGDSENLVTDSAESTSSSDASRSTAVTTSRSATTTSTTGSSEAATGGEQQVPVTCQPLPPPKSSESPPLVATAARFSVPRAMFSWNQQGIPPFPPQPPPGLFNSAVPSHLQPFPGGFNWFNQPGLFLPPPPPPPPGFFPQLFSGQRQNQNQANTGFPLPQFLPPFAPWQHPSVNQQSATQPTQAVPNSSTANAVSSTIPTPQPQQPQATSQQPAAAEAQHNPPAPPGPTAEGIRRRVPPSPAAESVRPEPGPPTVAAAAAGVRNEDRQDQMQTFVFVIMSMLAMMLAFLFLRRIMFM